MNFAIILATLIIDGKKHGMHPFLTPLRSMEDHKPLPGTENSQTFHTLFTIGEGVSSVE